MEIDSRVYVFKMGYEWIMIGEAGYKNERRPQTGVLEYFDAIVLNVLLFLFNGGEEVRKI